MDIIYIKFNRDFQDLVKKKKIRKNNYGPIEKATDLRLTKNYHH
jgi:hypothetical protein